MSDWDLEVRPHLTPYFAYGAAAVILATHVTVGVLLKISSTGAQGVAVRNLLGYRLIPWSDVVDVTFPQGARWARVDLPDDEYIPVMAIQAVDKERAVDAMDSVRGLLARYRPDLSPHCEAEALVHAPGNGVVYRHPERDHARSPVARPIHRRGDQRPGQPVAAGGRVEPK